MRFSLNAREVDVAYGPVQVLFGVDFEVPMDGPGVVVGVAVHGAVRLAGPLDRRSNDRDLFSGGAVFTVYRIGQTPSV